MNRFEVITPADVASASRLMAVIVGRIMIDSTIPAVRYPTPYTGPENSGRDPNTIFRPGPMLSRIIGTIVKMASRP